MMSWKNHTTCKIISIFLLTICGVSSLYRFVPSPLAHSSYTPHKVVAPPIQAQYLLAGTDHKLSLHFLKDLKHYFTLKTIIGIAIGIVAILVLCFKVGSEYDYGSQISRRYTHPGGADIPMQKSSNITSRGDLEHQRKIDNALSVIYSIITGKDIGKRSTGVSNAATIAAITMFDQLSNPSAPPINTSSIPYQQINALKTITINMEYVHKYYQAFIPILFSDEEGCENLLLFDKIAKTFPNVTQIICKNTDYLPQDNNSPDLYSADVGNKIFINELLFQIPERGKLKKIIIQTKERPINSFYLSLVHLFDDKKWSIQKGSYKDAHGINHKNQALTLSKNWF